MSQRKNQGRNREHDENKSIVRTIREQRKVIESQKRDIKRLQKEVARLTGTETVDDEKEESQVFTEVPVERSNRCPDCGKDGIKRVELPIRGVAYEFLSCQYCGFRKKTSTTKK